MRILFVLPEYPPHHGGGLLVYYRHLAPVLAALGHDVHVRVAAPFGDGFPDYAHAGVHVRFVSGADVDARSREFDRYILAPSLRRFLGAAWAAYDAESGGRDFDVIETADWGLLFAPWVADTTGPPVCVTLHGSAGQIDGWDQVAGQELQGTLLRLVEQGGLRRADALHTYGAANRETWEGLTSRSVQFHFPGWAAPDHEAGTLEGDALVVGRVQPWKGPEVLCRAIRLLGKECPAKILWAGRGLPYRALPSYEGYLEKAFPDAWGKIVVPLGQQSEEETIALQRRASFVLVPSTWDVFNYTCVEAMARGKVVLCSTGAGASGLITEGENGFLFKAGDAVSLAESLKRVLALERTSRERIGEKARAAVLELLNPARLARFKEAAYRSMAHEDRKRRKDDPWFLDAVSPRNTADADALKVLDALPTRTLVREAGRRIARRLGW